MFSGYLGYMVDLVDQCTGNANFVNSLAGLSWNAPKSGLAKSMPGSGLVMHPGRYRGSCAKG